MSRKRSSFPTSDQSLTDVRWWLHVSLGDLQDGKPPLANSCRCLFRFSLVHSLSLSAKSTVSTGLELESHCTTNIAPCWTFLSFSVLFWHKNHHKIMQCSNTCRGPAKQPASLAGEAWGRPLDLPSPAPLGLIAPFQDENCTTARVAFLLEESVAGVGGEAPPLCWAPELGQRHKWAYRVPQKCSTGRSKHLRAQLHWQRTSNVETGTAIRLLAQALYFEVSTLILAFSLLTLVLVCVQLFL